jgi:hypothetical protein
MNNPVKVVFKYKNNNNKIQYNIYIFIGNVPNPIQNILKSIKNNSLYDMLINTDIKNIEKLNKFYGDNWFTYFFNSYHIQQTINNIKSSKKYNDEIIKIYGKEWYTSHILQNAILNKINKNIITYDEIVKHNENKFKQKKKINVNEDDTIDNFIIVKKKQYGGTFNNNDDLNDIDDIDDNYDDNDDNDDIDDIDDDTNDDNTNNDNDDIDDDNTNDDNDDTDENDENDTTEDIDNTDNIYKYDTDDTNDTDDNGVDDKINIKNDSDNIDEMNEDDIIDMYKTIENTPHDKNTLKMINKLIDVKDKIIEFDNSNDENMYDEELKDIYIKNYIFDEYIYDDDTIKTIKNKICRNIKNNSKFGENSYIIPSRQYLWSEYVYNNEMKYIMLGHKIIKRHELLSIDIVPHSNIAIYEELRENLKILYDILKRHKHRIKRVDIENYILSDYNNYYTNNELFMIDIYNELGQNYNPTSDTIKNLINVYLYVYFPKIKSDDFKGIIEYLNNKSKIENLKLFNIHSTINNDLILENEIMNLVENTKIELKKTKYNILTKSSITNSVIHLNLKYENKELNENLHTFDLYRIFNKFKMTDEYPFIQFKQSDGQIIFKYKTDFDFQQQKNSNNSSLMKWFESSYIGLLFKIKIIVNGIEKNISININEHGRVDYKKQWKEEENASIDNITETYEYVKNLIKKINEITDSKKQIKIPNNIDFNLAFINSIVKFELPNNFIINHNDLSDFSRNFFPYISMVTEPRKRMSKNDKDTIKTSKFGTYLRYKRISNYDIPFKIEQKILYFIRNYEINETVLINEISNYFSITDEDAKNEIIKIKEKYPYIKKSRKKLKKMENLKRTNPPGIGLSIQGKSKDNYMIRIFGARNKQQMDKIIHFLNILIYLYTETYLFKKKDKQYLKDKLIKLTNIAKRRNQVKEVVIYSTDKTGVKKLIESDKQRLNMITEKGKIQYSRYCQNNGKQKRQPSQTNKIDDLLKDGYKYNNKNGLYEKTGKNNKKYRAVKLPVLNNLKEFTGNYLYYTCSPAKNNKFEYIGFATKNDNPDTMCLPCCFKKDMMYSVNKKKKDVYNKCINLNNIKNEVVLANNEINVETDVDILYILKNNNKIPFNRLGLLPKLFEIYLNKFENNKKYIKNHILIKTDGYFFKYGTNTLKQPYIEALSSILNLSVKNIINKCIKILNADKNNIIFTSLNKGDIKTQFKTKKKFIEYLDNEYFIDHYLINDLLQLPDFINNNQLQIIIFNKIIKNVTHEDQDDYLVEDYYLLNDLSHFIKHTAQNNNLQIILLIKENNIYFPIVFVEKKDENNKNINIYKLFNINNNIINNLLDFCKTSLYYDSLIVPDKIFNHFISPTAIDIYYDLINIKKIDYIPKYQYCDKRNKCIYLITSNKYIIPVKPSGSIYNIEIVDSIESYLQTLKNTLLFLNNVNSYISKIYSENELLFNPIGLYYDHIKNNDYHIIGILLENTEIVPIIHEYINKNDTLLKNFILENKQLNDKINEEINKGRENFIIDDRILNVSVDKFHNESYELFRLEFSNFICKNKNISIKKKLLKIINDNNLYNKNLIITGLLYKLIDKKLSEIYIEKIKKNNDNSDSTVNSYFDSNTDTDTNTLSDTIDSDTIGSDSNIDSDINIYSDIDKTNSQLHNNSIQIGGDKLFVTINTKPNDLSSYKINNYREKCENLNKMDCSTNAHCYNINNNCTFSITLEMLIEFITKIGNELSNNSYKTFELLNINDYFVNDIIDYDKFDENPKYKIIKTGYLFDKFINELFKKNIPTIGKQKINKETTTNELNSENPLKNYKNIYLQNIIKDSLSCFRSYVNCYFWLKNNLFDIEIRNLGHYSLLQTELANYCKSLIINWLNNNNNKEEIEKHLLQYLMIPNATYSKIKDFIIKLGNNINVFSNYIIELFVISKILKYIIYVYNNDDEIIYIFDNGLIFNDNIDDISDKKYITYLNENTIHLSINIKFYFENNKYIPHKIESIYYKNN